MKKLRIDILCNDGSPLNTCLDDIYGKRNRIGLGGAELALHTVCEALHNNGHRVKLYNSPQTSGGSPYGQYPVDTFLPHEDRDILIIFRSPNHRSMEAKGRKIWWSCDQFTVGNFAEFAPTVDKIITISPYHANHFKTIYDIENTITIDLPVRMQDYEQTVRKIPHRMIYCSIPDGDYQFWYLLIVEFKGKFPMYLYQLLRIIDCGELEMHEMNYIFVNF